jgi:hypothetical protein
VPCHGGALSLDGLTHRNPKLGEQRDVLIGRQYDHPIGYVAEIGSGLTAFAISVVMLAFARQDPVKHQVSMVEGCRSPSCQLARSRSDVSSADPGSVV